MTSKDDFKELALLIMKQNGLRLTKPRHTILGFLAEQSRAMTPFEIQYQLKMRKLKLDLVTIYRILENFEKLGLVHKVMALGRYIRCHEAEIAQHCEKDDQCHHYLICQGCHRIEEIAGENLHDLESKLKKKLHWEIYSHSLEFLGLCEECRKSA